MAVGDRHAKAPSCILHPNYSYLVSLHEAAFVSSEA